MSNKPENCEHKELMFGSGDFYVICNHCGRYWAMIDMSTSEHRIAPDLANIGKGTYLSGKLRVELPDYCTVKYGSK